MSKFKKDDKVADYRTPNKLLGTVIATHQWQGRNRVEINLFNKGNKVEFDENKLVKFKK